jgi:hypothetical protein
VQDKLFLSSSGKTFSSATCNDRYGLAFWSATYKTTIFELLVCESDDNISIYTKAQSEGRLDEPSTTTQVIILPPGWYQTDVSTSQLLTTLAQ